jgi:hypothetical protein
VALLAAVGRPSEHDAVAPQVVLVHLELLAKGEQDLRVLVVLAHVLQQLIEHVA